MMTSPQLQTWCGSMPWHYRANGQGERCLFVLGAPPVSLIPLFDGTRRVISAPTPPAHTVLQVSEALIELLDGEGLRRVDLFGHGTGAAVAHAFVRRHPDRVDRLALSGFGLWSPAKARWMRWLSPHPMFDDLFLQRQAYRVDQPELSPGRVMLVLDADGGQFSRHDEHALARTYPGAITTFAGGHQLEHKLELFFRVPHVGAPPALPRSA